MTRLGLILMLALGVACGDDDVRMADTGTAPTDAGTDAGQITFDTGPEEDAGIVLVDAGGTDSGPVGTDAGLTCTPRPIAAIPPAQLPRCEAATLQCLIDCGADAACQGGCLAADATPAAEGIDCQICISSQQISCGVSMGCDDEYGIVDCCIQDNMCADQACIDTNCGAQQTGLQTCLQGVGAACMPAVQSCFAS